MLNWAEIDAAALQHNLREFRRRVGPSTLLAPVVKSNGYGHGLEIAATAAKSGGADWLCVNNLDEAIELDELHLGLPILILGYVPLEGLADVVARGLRLVVYNLESVARLGAEATRLRKRVRVHVKAETGTHRQGVVEADVPAFVRAIAAMGSLDIEGMSTHFANIEDTTNRAFAEGQIAAFERIYRAAVAEVGPIPIRHAACSAAAVLLKKTHLDLVRLGISFYGVWSSKETLASQLEQPGDRLDLRPALTWKTRIAQVKDVPEGAFVGYGCTYRTTRASKIAVLPVGYFEGYDRSLSGVGHVLVRGKRAPVRGRICMNMCMVDLTDVPGVSLEDEVVLLGRQGDEQVSAEQVAAWCGTIPYEVLARIGATVRRVAVRGKREAL